MSEQPPISGSGDVPTVNVKDGQGQELLCFLEQLIPLDGNDYALLTPVDTPVCLFRLSDEDEPELIEPANASEPVLSTAEVVLQEHELTLVRSAVTLTVAGELDEPDPEELELDADEDEPPALPVCPERQTERKTETVVDKNAIFAEIRSCRRKNRKT